MSTQANQKVLANKSIVTVVKLSREYPKTAQNANLLKLYLEKHGRQERKS
jgi:hypothetical protein